MKKLEHVVYMACLSSLQGAMDDDMARGVLYLLDRESIKYSGMPMSGLSYKHTFNGPIADITCERIRSIEDAYMKDEKSPDDLDELSDFEKDIIIRTLNMIENPLDNFYLRDRLRSLPEFDDNKIGEKIDIVDIIKHATICTHEEAWAYAEANKISLEAVQEDRQRHVDIIIKGYKR